MIIGQDIVGDWDMFFEDIFDNKSVRANLNALNQRYLKKHPKIYPEQKNVFRAFKECPYSKLSVVVILQDPYHDGNATGIGLANPEGSTSFSPSLRIVKDTITRTVYNNHDFDFNPNLLNWANQGILLINAALTVEEGNPLSHMTLWARFTELFLTKLSQVNCGLIYCLWGKEANRYSYLINGETNTILRSSHPVSSIYRGIPWDCNHFVMINDQLKKFNNMSIIW